MILPICTSSKSNSLFHNISRKTAKYLKHYYKNYPNADLDSFRSSAKILIRAYERGTPEDKEFGMRILRGSASGTAVTLRGVEDSSIAYVEKKQEKHKKKKQKEKHYKTQKQVKTRKLTKTTKGGCPND